MSKKIEQTNPIRVYAETREKEYALVQIVDYYNETFRYEILTSVTATVFPNIVVAQTAVNEFKKFHPSIDVDNFKYVEVLNYKK
ncbi:hypothetical protein NZD88_19830 [Chryseobacterium antibioticum]|uniref:Uncharacterized protein n=1 Tax=Chryseobacterium pyrolae TaxID=2987481 RepID=A0ABT2IMK7_9FLAO|nr:hypothetical protein [Chryseobacterium pyrolae]MCT2409809.1 hypothetical protein [Chryseobacterium pyrolae]